MPRTTNKRTVKSNAAATCPLTTKPRLRFASDQQTDSIKDNFPGGIARPALRALLAAKLTRLDQLTTVTENELAALHGMGPKAVTILRDALQARGCGFRSSR